MADQTPDDGQQNGPANRYSAELLDRLAQEITDGADTEAKFDPAPDLTRWAAKRLDPLADEREMDGIVAATRDRRAGAPDGSEVGQAVAARRARRGVVA